MRNKYKIIKDIIKHDRYRGCYYYFDKYLFITKIDINKLIPIDNVNCTRVYKVYYKHRFRLYNPFTWVVLLIILAAYILDGGILEFWEDIQPCECCDTVMIND